MGDDGMFLFCRLEVFRLHLFSHVQAENKGHLNLTAINQFQKSCKKIIELRGGQIIDPSSVKHFSLPFLPATPLSLSRTIEGLFELLDSGTLEIQGHRKATYGNHFYQWVLRTKTAQQEEQEQL